jgi:hypothetical protein
MMHVTMGSVSAFNVYRPERTHLVLVQPEMERGRSPLVSIPPLGGDFQGIGIYRYDGGLGQRKKVMPAPPFIVSIDPPGYPSVWLRPRRARFQFHWRSHCVAVVHVLLNQSDS